MNTTAIVDSTSEPAFAVDLEGKVVAWNRAAENCLGRSRAQVVGRYCWDVLAGRDPFGNCYCGPACPIMGMAKRREAIHRTELDIQAADGSTERFRVATLLVPGAHPPGSLLLHQASRMSSRGGTGRARERAASGERGAGRKLTSRERQVLGHLAEGRGTDELAQLLCVSPQTVRNHIRHILRKLGARSRLEAVARGRRLGLV